MMSFGKPLRQLGAALGVWLAFATSASAESLGINFLQIDPRANIFSAGSTSPTAPGGGGAGILPTLVPVDPIAATSGNSSPMQRVFTLSNISSDSTLSADGIRFNGLDGGASFGGRTQLNGVGGISGINHDDRTMFLTGVFLGNSLSSSTNLPALAFNSNTDFAELKPGIGQPFFIGDGKNNTGQAQRFVAPDTATRLFLGIADGFNFVGNPGFYDDNQGKINLNYNITAVPVPEPATFFGWCAAMGAAAAWGIRRRRTMRLS